MRKWKQTQRSWSLSILSHIFWAGWINVYTHHLCSFLLCYYAYHWATLESLLDWLQNEAPSISWLQRTLPEEVQGPGVEKSDGKASRCCSAWKMFLLIRSSKLIPTHSLTVSLDPGSCIHHALFHLPKAGTDLDLDRLLKCSARSCKWLWHLGHSESVIGTALTYLWTGKHWKQSACISFLPGLWVPNYFLSIT